MPKGIVNKVNWKEVKKAVDLDITQDKIIEAVRLATEEILHGLAAFAAAVLIGESIRAEVLKMDGDETDADVIATKWFEFGLKVQPVVRAWLVRQVFGKGSSKWWLKLIFG